MNRFLLTFTLLKFIISMALSAQVTPKFWGTTAQGGVASPNHLPGGTIFSINGNGTDFKRHYTFEYENPGRNPRGNTLLQANNGKLYGTTLRGGKYTWGTLFEFDPVTKDYLVLHHFNADSAAGAYPVGNLIENAGVLYGVASGGGGPNSAGTIYSYNYTTNSFTVLHHFTPGTGTGTNPAGGMLQVDSNLFYGMTNGGGLNSIHGVIYEFNI